MTNEILSKTNYLKAITLEDALKPLLANIERLRPMIATLSKVDTRFIGLESLYLTGLTSLSDLSHILQDATIGDKQQAENRGMRQLSNLCHTRLCEIQSDLSRVHAGFKAGQDRYDHAINQLQVTGYNQLQIDRIMETTPKPTLQTYEAEVAALTRENEALEAFVVDFPRYDQELLIGTSFENWQPEKVVDFDAAAKALAV